MAVQSHKGRHYFWEHVCFLQYFRLAEAEELMSEDLWSRWQESPPARETGQVLLWQWAQVAWEIRGHKL